MGSALPAVHLQIVDDADKPLLRGEVGMIRIRASGLAERYLDATETTAKVFRGGWFYPGDLGSFTEDDQLIYKGRADDMMIFDGINIFPAEIKAVLASDEAVEEAAAFPLKSEIHQDVPVAAVKVCAPVAESELVANCRARLGLQVPRRIFEVTAFPRNPAGKLLKRELAEQLRLKPATISSSPPGAAETNRN